MAFGLCSSSLLSLFPSPYKDVQQSDDPQESVVRSSQPAETPSPDQQVESSTLAVAADQSSPVPQLPSAPPQGEYPPPYTANQQHPATLDGGFAEPEPIHPHQQPSPVRLPSAPLQDQLLALPSIMQPPTVRNHTLDLPIDRVCVALGARARLKKILSSFTLSFSCTRMWFCGKSGKINLHTYICNT